VNDGKLPLEFRDLIEARFKNAMGCFCSTVVTDRQRNFSRAPCLNQAGAPFSSVPPAGDKFGLTEQRLMINCSRSG
jgi:hypothetical protein